ncbi:MAG: BspA family leucine-rich repeat surface protein [Cellulosilyticaceae bacterium]
MNSLKEKVKQKLSSITNVFKGKELKQTNIEETTENKVVVIKEEMSTTLQVDISSIKNPTLYIRNETGEPLIINWGYGGGDTELFGTTNTSITKTEEYPKDQKLALITISRSKDIVEKDNELKLYTFGDGDNAVNTELISIAAGKGSSVDRLAFCKCKKLENADLKECNTNNVKDMSYMFASCSELKLLDLQGWDNKEVKIMNGMFFACSSLQSINLSGFKTTKVEHMGEMFNECSSLNTIDLSEFDTQNVRRMNYMFNKCSALKELNLSNFYTPQLEDISNMFSECSNLELLDISKLETRNIRRMSYTFHKCINLKKVDLKAFDTSNVVSMIAMFSECSSLEELDLSSFNTESLKEMTNMFSGCSSLETLCLDKFDTDEVNCMAFAFSENNADNTSGANMLNKLKKVTLGEKFQFIGNNACLPIPNSEYIEGADGKWYDNETNKPYEPSEVHKNANIKKTYVAVCNSEHTESDNTEI